MTVQIPGHAWPRIESNTKQTFRVIADLELTQAQADQVSIVAVVCILGYCAASMVERSCVHLYFAQESKGNKPRAEQSVVGGHDERSQGGLASASSTGYCNCNSWRWRCSLALLDLGAKQKRERKNNKPKLGQREWNPEQYAVYGELESD